MKFIEKRNCQDSGRAKRPVRSLMYPSDFRCALKNLITNSHTGLRCLTTIATQLKQKTAARSIQPHEKAKLVPKFLKSQI